MFSSSRKARNYYTSEEKKILRKEIFRYFFIITAPTIAIMPRSSLNLFGDNIYAYISFKRSYMLIYK